jgi:hypothetical protein
MLRKIIAYGLAGLSLCVARPARAQTVQGVITGTVFDPSGAVLPGATVTIINEGTSVSQSTTTDRDGSYRFPLVPPGTYTVQVKATGFAEYLRKNVTVDPSQAVSLDVTLEVGKATQTVEVTSQAPLVQTSTSDLAHTVNNVTITSMPLIGRNVYDLAFAAPQVTQGMNFGAASGGEREAGTAYLLNGSDNNDNFGEGAQNITPPLESVQEFSILTNQMSAQYGRGGGAVVSAVQKSGTNSFHGVAYEFNRNRSLNASDFFSNRAGHPKPKYIRNQFGGEVDGPIVKDKTFFAFAYDQIALHTGGDTVTSVPTPALLSQLTQGAGQIASYYLNKYPPITSSALCPAEAANNPAAVGFIGCTTFFDPFEQPEHNYYGRIDQNFSTKDRLSFTANVHRFTGTDKYGGGHVSVKPINSQDREHYHNLTLVETHTFTPQLINELTIAHNRHYSNFLEGGGKNLDPEIIIDGADYAGLAFGFGPYEGGLIQLFTQDRWQLQDNASLMAGKHSFKFGGGWQHGILYRNWDLGLPGYYEFGNVLGPSIAAAAAAGEVTVNPDGSITNVSDSTVSNFQHDFPYFQELSIDPRTGARANAYRHYIMNDTYLFVNDDFKVKPHFTLNLGLRWDIYGAPTEQHGILAQFVNFNCIHSTTISFIDCIANARTGPVPRMWNTRLGDFGPRVGFAWDVFGDGRTAVRGGFGISYDRIFDNVWSNGAWNPPFYGLIDWDATIGDTIFYSNPPRPSPSYVPNSLPGPAGRVSVRTMENNLKDSSVQNFYLGVEHQFAQNLLVRVNYQGSLGRHLPVLMNWNRYDGEGYNRAFKAVRPNPDYTGFNYRANNINSSYHALVTEVQKRLSNGLQFQGGYTWSHLIDFNSDLFAGSTIQGAYSQPYYFISNNHKNLERGSGAFDHRHNFKVAFTYQLPFLRDQKGFLGKVVGGWQVTGFYQAYSGHPIEVYCGRARYKGDAVDANGVPENIGCDYNLDRVNNDHPDFVGSGSIYSHGSPADGIFTDVNPIGCGFAGQLSSAAATAKCNANFGVVTPNKLFVNPSGEGIKFGGLGRNVFHGPWFNGLDAGLSKNFKLNERWNLQFRTDVANVLNHPNFDAIDTNLNSGGFGKANCTVGDSTCPAGAAPARRIQFGLRLLF